MTNTPKTIYVKNGTGKTHKYHLYESFDKKKEAVKLAKWHKKKNKSKYVITKTKTNSILGYVTPTGITNEITKHNLYLNRVIKLW